MFKGGNSFTLSGTSADGETFAVFGDLGLTLGEVIGAGGGSTGGSGATGSAEAGAGAGAGVGSGAGAGSEAGADSVVGAV